MVSLFRFGDYGTNQSIVQSDLERARFHGHLIAVEKQFAAHLFPETFIAIKAVINSFVAYGINMERPMLTRLQAVDYKFRAVDGEPEIYKIRRSGIRNNQFSLRRLIRLASEDN